MGDTRFDTGVGFLSVLVRLERNLRPFHFYTAEGTPPRQDILTPNKSASSGSGGSAGSVGP
jgi:hypothetical protein